VTQLSGAEFDGVAEVYDETRRALNAKTLRGLLAILSAHHCQSMLEIGVGTGRVAAPLIRNGINVAGVDVSRMMMEKAKSKGILNLVQADGRTPPFREESFDGVIMAHVFHLLEDPMAVIDQAASLAKVGVFALLRKRDGGMGWFPFYGFGNSTGNPEIQEDDPASKFLQERRERFRQIAEKYHWTWDRARFRNWRREAEILESHPPDELKVVSDVLVTETVEDRIARFEKGGFSFNRDMPAEMKKEIIQEIRSGASSFPRPLNQPRREIYQVAFWSSEGLRRQQHAVASTA